MEQKLHVSRFSDQLGNIADWAFASGVKAEVLGAVEQGLISRGDALRLAQDLRGASTCKERDKLLEAACPQAARRSAFSWSMWCGFGQGMII